MGGSRANFKRGRKGRNWFRNGKSIRQFPTSFGKGNMLFPRFEKRFNQKRGGGRTKRKKRLKTRVDASPQLTAGNSLGNGAPSDKKNGH